MHDPTSNDFVIEVLASDQKIQTDHLGDWEELRAQAAGASAERREGTDTEERPENAVLEWQAFMMPRLAGGDPHILCSSRQGPAQSAMARGLGRVVNTISTRLQYRSLAERLAVDFGLKWCVSMLRHSPDLPRSAMRGWKSGTRVPHAVRISPTRFCWDIGAIDSDDIAWYSHQDLISRDDFLEMAETDNDNAPRGWSDWDLTAIQNLTKASRILAWKRHTGEDVHAQRDEIGVRYAWIPGYTEEGWPDPEEGYNGAWVCLAEGRAWEGGLGGEDGVILRPPWPAFNPPSGPYNIAGMYTMADDTAPLGILSATRVQAEYRNRSTMAILQMIEDYKVFMAVKASEEAIAQIVAQAEHHSIVGVPGIEELARDALRMQVGGLDQHVLAAGQLIGELHDRSVGLNEIDRGNVKGIATATEIQNAQAGGQVRALHQVKKFYGLWENIMTGMGHMAFFADDAGWDVVEPDGTEIRIHAGGDGSEDVEWDQLDWEIDALSMVAASDADQAGQASAIDLFVTTWVPMIRAFPEIDWRPLVESYAHLRRVPMIRDVVDYQKSVAIFEMQAQAGEIGPAQPTGAPTKFTLVPGGSKGFGSNQGQAPNALKSMRDQGAPAQSGSVTPAAQTMGA